MHLIAPTRQWPVNLLRKGPGQCQERELRSSWRNPLRRNLPGPQGVAGNAIPGALPIADATGFVIALANTLAVPQN